MALEMDDGDKRGGGMRERNVGLLIPSPLTIRGAWREVLSSRPLLKALYPLFQVAPCGGKEYVKLYDPYTPREAMEDEP